MTDKRAEAAERSRWPFTAQDAVARLEAEIILLKEEIAALKETASKAILDCHVATTEKQRLERVEKQLRADLAAAREPNAAAWMRDDGTLECVRMHGEAKGSGQEVAHAGQVVRVNVSVVDGERGE